MKQGHVSNRESVGGLAKVVNCWCVCVGGGGCSLNQSLLRLFAFKQLSTEIVYMILLMHGNNAINHPNRILVFSTLHAVSYTK